MLSSAKNFSLKHLYYIAVGIADCLYVVSSTDFQIPGGSCSPRPEQSILFWMWRHRKPAKRQYGRPVAPWLLLLALHTVFACIYYLHRVSCGFSRILVDCYAVWRVQSALAPAASHVAYKLHDFGCVLWPAVEKFWTDFLRKLGRRRAGGVAEIQIERTLAWECL